MKRLIAKLISSVFIVTVFASIGYASFTVRDGRTVPVGSQSNQNAFYAFEENQVFWGDWGADTGTAAARIDEPTSANGDDKAWRSVLTDTPGGGQRFSLIGWALGDLEVPQGRSLVFRVRGQNGFEPFEIGLKSVGGATHRVRDAGSIDHPNIGDFIEGPGSTITTSYQTVRIPLSEFSSHGVDISRLDSFEIISVASDGQNITIYLDAMGFE